VGRSPWTAPDALVRLPPTNKAILPLQAKPGQGAERGRGRPPHTEPGIVRYWMGQRTRHSSAAR